MKRVLSLFLAVILCFSLFAVVFADEDEHGETHRHRWSEWKEQRAPTCTAAGERTRSCECGETQTETIQPLGHSWGAWKDDGNDSTHSHTCTRSGCTERETVAHSGEIVAEEALHYYVCSACGAKYGEEEHVVGTTWVHDANNHWQVCEVCGYQANTAAHKWNGGKVTKQATCVQKGVKTYTCTVCGATKTQEIPLTQHSWDGGQTTIEPTITEKGESTFKCIVCGKVATREIDPLGLSMTPEELLTVEAAPGNALNAKIEDEKWVVLQSVTTEDEYKRIDGGWPMTVTLNVQEISGLISLDTMEKVEETAGKQKIYAYLDIGLTKQMYEDPVIEIQELKEPIIISLTLPEELLETATKHKERGFTVYRIDENDELEKVAAHLSEDETCLLLQTDKIGRYALAYHDRHMARFDPILLLYGGLGLLTLGGIGFLAYKLFFDRSRESDYDNDAYTEYDDEYEEPDNGFLSRLKLLSSRPRKRR